MKLTTLILGAVVLSGCAARATAPVAVTASNAANVMALVAVPAASASEQAQEQSVDLSGLDLDVPSTQHDFSLRSHVVGAPAVRCSNGGVTIACGAAPADDTTFPKAASPNDVFPIPAPVHK